MLLPIKQLPCVKMQHTAHVGADPMLRRLSSLCEWPCAFRKGAATCGGDAELMNACLLHDGLGFRVCCGAQNTEGIPPVPTQLVPVK